MWLLVISSLSPLSSHHIITYISHHLTSNRLLNEAAQPSPDHFRVKQLKRCALDVIQSLEDLVDALDDPEVIIINIFGWILFTALLLFGGVHAENPFTHPLFHLLFCFNSADNFSTIPFCFFFTSLLQQGDPNSYQASLRETAGLARNLDAIMIGSPNNGGSGGIANNNKGGGDTGSAAGKLTFSSSHVVYFCLHLIVDCLRCLILLMLQIFVHLGDVAPKSRSAFSFKFSSKTSTSASSTATAEKRLSAGGTAKQAGKA